jgi:dienelactone hydrolase
MPPLVAQNYSSTVRAVAIFLFLIGCVGANPTSNHTTDRNSALPQIPFKLLKPDGAGPFPAVVIMHDCSGLGPRSSGAPERWAKELLGHGYVIFIPDSFTMRGFPEGVCTDPSPSRREVSPVRRAADAYAALAHLRTLSFVDPSRVGLMGGSHGGSTTLASMVTSKTEQDLFLREKHASFAAAVALYPGCAFQYGDWRAVRKPAPGAPITGYSGVYKPLAPLLILIGENDDWTPAEPCEKLAEAAQAAGYPISIRVYPGAHHAFDSDRPVRYVAQRINPNSSTGRGATTGGNPKAWADSINAVVSFFGNHLKQSQK